MKTAQRVRWTWRRCQPIPNLSPHYHLVPKDFDKNLKFRSEMLRFGRRGEAEQRLLRQMCKDDILFWINTFGFIHEPRNIGAADRFNHVLPWITWDFQDEIILELESCLGKEDVAVRKSRENTFTWDLIAVYTHRLDFYSGEAYCLVSWKESMVETRDDLGTLLPKIDFINDHQPAWLYPPIERTVLRRVNTETKTIVVGESTNANISRSKRLTGMGFDEYHFVPSPDDYTVLAASQNATDSRFFISTINRERGRTGAYMDVLNRPGIHVIEALWHKHPRKRRGLYTSQNGELVLIDKSHRFPDGYAFVLDGKLRSPYYDAECARANDPGLIAAELDANPEGSAANYFDPAVTRSNIEAFAREPTWKGRLVYDRQSLLPIEFDSVQDGNLWLWDSGFDRDEIGKPVPRPEVRYGIGVDISSGSGASFSCISIGNLDTGEKCGEFVTSGYVTGEIDSGGNPIRFNDSILGQYAVALCRWLNNAFIMHDAFGGQGANFGLVVLDAGYWNLHFKRDESTVSRRTTDKPGYYAKGDARARLFGTYRDALRKAVTENPLTGAPLDGAFINPSKRALEETLQFIPSREGAEHVSMRNARDRADQGCGHGDITFADALLCMAMVDKKTSKPVFQPDEEYLNPMIAADRVKLAELADSFRSRDRWGFDTSGGWK